MKIYPASGPVPRVRVNALLSTEEAEVLQRLLEKLTEKDCLALADSEEEAAAFAQVASKMRRQLNAAEELPELPDYDD